MQNNYLKYVEYHVKINTGNVKTTYCLFVKKFVELVNNIFYNRTEVLRYINYLYTLRICIRYVSKEIEIEKKNHCDIILLNVLLLN